MRDDTIKVKVVEFGDRKHYQMQFADPLSGRKKTRSTGVERTGRKRERTEAERVAAKWESELREGRYQSPAKTTWEDFRERYEKEVLSGLSQGTDTKVQGVFNLLERIVNPLRLRDVTAERLSYFQSKLREGTDANGQPETRAESTIAGYMAHMKAAMGWAARMGMLPKAPEIAKVKRAKGGEVMKGRPITREEFERMLAKVPSIVGKPGAASWIGYLEGLWRSGLRLTESLSLSWDDDHKLAVDLSGKYPMLRIPAELEKGNKDRLLPLSPEFAETLLAAPMVDRTGYVFNPAGHTADIRPAREWVMRTIVAIGKSAGVKVATDAAGKVKFASAHDLRRSFGERWASRVMPQVLKELMRHETIETTLRYYVGRNAETTAAVLWEASKKAANGNTSGNSAENQPASNLSK